MIPTPDYSLGTALGNGFWLISQVLFVVFLGIGSSVGITLLLWVVSAIRGAFDEIL